jgi:hypothetical protein
MRSTRCERCAVSRSKAFRAPSKLNKLPKESIRKKQLPEMIKVLTIQVLGVGSAIPVLAGYDLNLCRKSFKPVFVIAKSLDDVRQDDAVAAVLCGCLEEISYRTEGESFSGENLQPRGIRPARFASIVIFRLFED